MPQTTEAQKILRRGDVEKLTGMRRSSLYAAVAEGKFPPPIRLSEKCVGWLESEIVDWQQRCIRERDARLAAPRRQRRRRKIEGWPK
jgi:prophage regulatory protein